MTTNDSGLTSLRHAWPCVVAWAIAAVFLCGLAVTCGLVWTTGSDCDLQERYWEYSWFRQGTYPNATIEREQGPWPSLYTVYLPYAFPMFAALFEPGGLAQGRIVVQSLSLAAIVIMGRYGYRTLLPAGKAVAFTGYVLAIAISGNLAAIKSGQLSVICMGLVFLQLMFLEANRPISAVACWSLAMVKPQIALPFAALFILTRNLVSLAAGCVLLVLLSGFACWWTGVDPGTLLHNWTMGKRFHFINDGFVFGPGSLARFMGIPNGVAMVLIAAVAGVITLCLVAALRRCPNPSILALAAVCSVLGMFTCYHRHYDNVMLLPAGLLAVSTAVETRRKPDIIAAIMFAATLAMPLPMRLLNAVPMVQFAVAGIWLIGGLRPVAYAVRQAGRRTDIA